VIFYFVNNETLLFLREDGTLSAHDFMLTFDLHYYKWGGSLLTLYTRYNEDEVYGKQARQEDFSIAPPLEKLIHKVSVYCITQSEYIEPSDLVLTSIIPET
jgi:hypothetical protein